MDEKAIEAAARAIDPLAFAEQGSCPPRGYECHTPQELSRVIAARRKHARHVAKTIIAAYREACREATDAERLNALEQMLIHGDETHVSFCLRDDADCNADEHPHFEVYGWHMDEPVHAKTLREAIDIAMRDEAGGEHV